MAKTRILYVIPSLASGGADGPLGGAERQLLLLTRCLDRSRYDPILCCLEEPGELPEEFDLPQVPGFCIGKRRRGDIPSLIRLAQLITRIKPTIVHTWQVSANFYGSLAARLAKCPIVLASEHTTGSPTGQHTFDDLVARRSVNWIMSIATDKVVPCSYAVQAFLLSQGIGKERMRVVVNGIELDEFDPSIVVADLRSEFGIPIGATVVGMVSRLVPGKDHRTLLRAAQIVVNEVVGSVFLIVGEGSEQSTLEELARSLGIQTKVIFTGYRTDVVRILSTLDVFVHTSLGEGLPLSILEAMAMGKPVIASEAEGNTEAIVDGVTGLTVPRQNPAALAEAIIALAQDSNRAHSMGEAGRRHVLEYYSAKRMVAEFEALYSELLEQRALNKVTVQGRKANLTQSMS